MLGPARLPLSSKAITITRLIAFEIPKCYRSDARESTTLHADPAGILGAYTACCAMACGYRHRGEQDGQDGGYREARERAPRPAR